MSAASHSERRWGVKVSLQGGPVGCGLEDGGKGSRFALLPKSGGGVSYWSQIHQSCRLGPGVLRECPGRAWRERGVHSPPSRRFGAQEQGGPLPQPQAQAALSLRSWTGQHSCGRGPLPPACLNLAPASGDPAPPPTRWRRPRATCRKAPCFGGEGRPALVRSRWEDVCGNAEVK